MTKIVYPVIVTYEDYQQDLDNIFPTHESAVAYAKDLFRKCKDIHSIQVNMSEITTQYGLGWLKTLYYDKRDYTE